MAADLDFFSWVYSGDAALALGMVQSVKAFYPDRTVLLLMDGALDPADQSALEAAGATCLATPATKAFGQCEAYLKAGFDLVLANSAATRFIQLDPETRCHRVAYLPAGEWVGQIRLDPDQSIGRMAVGCGALLSRDFLAAVSSELETPDGTDFRYTLNEVEKPSSDLTLAYYAKKLGYKPLPWATPIGLSEVYLKWEPDSAFDSGKWAFTHPHSA